MPRYMDREGISESERRKKFRYDLDISMYGGKTCPHCGAQFDHMNCASHPQFTCGTTTGWDSRYGSYRTKKCVENELKIRVIDNPIKNGMCTLCYSKWLSEGEIIHDRDCLIYLAKEFGVNHV